MVPLYRMIGIFCVHELSPLELKLLLQRDVSVGATREFADR